MDIRWSSAIAATATPNTIGSSRLPKFYNLPLHERANIAKNIGKLTTAEFNSLNNYQGMSRELTDTFIENAIGTFSLPLGLASNFLINTKDYLVPMVVEESSVLAAASHGAKLVRAGGGFQAQSTEAIMTGQIQLLLKDVCPYDTILKEQRADLINYANVGQDRLIMRGGGVCGLDWHLLPALNHLIVHVHVNTCDAMGANIVNTICERLARRLQMLIPCDIGLQILTNLNDQRRAKASCEIPAKVFDCTRFDGLEVVERIEQAYQFAAHDPYRAATNNKGIMNGIDPVVIATGNDWRAVEAGAHAYACRSGHYKPLAYWRRVGNYLQGEIDLPLALGIVGGVTKLHPNATAALKILGQPNARALAEIVCCAGLAQNLAALRALSTEGIQKGHMHLHAKNLQQQRQTLYLEQR
ncbi:MAG: hydroxymethylglutaryl-CoA reductase, degradative [Pseudomonadota bacterium]|nr:hydroxymethylglutaryl-CoA reductase, degradative [Pseudomonadota bacterium]